jgi:hypothetical protein
MWEIFLEGHILSTVGDALTTTTSSQLGTILKYVIFSKHLQFSTEIDFSYKCPILMVTNVKLVIWLGLHKLIDYYG